MVVLVEGWLAPLLRDLLGSDFQWLNQVRALMDLHEPDVVLSGMMLAELDFRELGHGLADDVEVGELGKPLLGRERRGCAGAVEC